MASNFANIVDLSFVTSSTEFSEFVASNALKLTVTTEFVMVENKMNAYKIVDKCDRFIVLHIRRDGMVSMYPSPYKGSKDSAGLRMIIRHMQKKFI